MSFDSTGLTIKDEATILDELNTEVLENLRSIPSLLTEDVVIDTSEVSPFGKTHAILAKRLSDVWKVAKQIEESMRVDSATSASLEKLALLVGFVRNPDTKTTGDLLFYGEDGTLIPQGSIFSNVQGDEFTNPADVLITLTNCYSFNVSVGVLRNSREYSISVNTSAVTITSPASNATNQSILILLRDQLNNVSYEQDVTATVNIDGGSTEDEDYYLSIVYNDPVLTMSAEVSPLLVSNSVSVESLVESSSAGVVFGAADTVSTIITSLNGLDSINNRTDFILGEVSETDESLRSRVTTEFNVGGSGTTSTIKSLLTKNSNVRSAFIDENRLTTTSSSGVPPKAYEVILSHEGTSQQMGEIIWNTKPVGIETHGTTPVTVIDASGDPQIVNFTEATDLFVYFKVTGTTLPLNEGEALPEDYKVLIANNCTILGEAYEINQDVIGKRFYGTIFDNVAGIDDLEVQVHLSINESLNINSISDWRDTWVVGRTEISTYGNDRFLTTIS